MSASSGDRWEHFFQGFLRRAVPWVGVLTLLSLPLVFFASKVHSDFSVEYLFPDHDQAKTDYDRYKAVYPYEDARALVMVEATDLWTPAGLARVAALESDLAAIQIASPTAVTRDSPGGVTTVAAVNSVEGPLSIFDVVASGESVTRERLFPRAGLTQAEIDRRRAIATTDPIFRWQLAPPDGRSATIRVTVERPNALERGLPDVSGRDDLRNAFQKALRVVVAKHESPAQKIVISGLPIIRSEYTEMIDRDKSVMLPLSSAVIFLLLFITFVPLREAWANLRGLRLGRLAASSKEVVAAFITIGASILWTRGAMGILGYPEQILTSILPTVVMIISISDTVHILGHYKDALAAGRTHEDALVHAMADSAWPCLLTEITVALGFLALWTVNIRLVSEFGVATAWGMMLTWIANMTVLPLSIHWLRPKPAEERHSEAERAFARFIGWIEAQVTERPRRVVACATAICAVALVFALRMGDEYYAFDDLRPGSPIKAEIEYAERTFGGCDPMVVFIEPKQKLGVDGEPLFQYQMVDGELASVPFYAGRWQRREPVLEPEAIRLADRISGMLESRFKADGVKRAFSAADYVKKAHRIFAGAEVADKDPIPGTRGLVAQELQPVDDGKILRDYIDFDRASLAVFVNMPDVGSSRIRDIVNRLNPLLRSEEAAMAAAGLPVTITITGMFAIGYDIYSTLVTGLLSSLAISILVSFGVFCVVLRSWRLGLMALVPNVVPLTLTFGFMGALGIQLTPTTVIVYSITLVIADDDTTQYFTRFKAVFAEAVARGEPDPYRYCCLLTLRESGLPMFITACAVSLGFLTMLSSQFLGLAHFGVLVGVSLFTAIFGDLFLTPIMLMKWKPRVFKDQAARVAAALAAPPPVAPGQVIEVKPVAARAPEPRP